MKFKKIGVFLTIVLWITTLVISFFIGMKYHWASTTEIKTTKDYSQIVVGENDVADYDISQIPISDAEYIAQLQENGITKQEAEKLCREILGEKAQENDFPISYQCIDVVYVNGKPYYVMRISWLVNNHHWSYIGDCYVSVDGQEIYDGIVSDAKYQMTELRWKK